MIINTMTDTTPTNAAQEISAAGLPDLPRVDNLFDIPIDFFTLLDNIAIGVVVAEVRPPDQSRRKKLKLGPGEFTNDGFAADLLPE